MIIITAIWYLRKVDHL